MKRASERITEDAQEICGRLEMNPLTPQQLMVISLIVGHEVERLESMIGALQANKKDK